ncbi:ATP-dependent DNA helicase RecG [Candidatus Falkowbacteria bacterium]|uniref:ATP-dependent DNA helicase RecG n=1 Tax=Candidatus Buchananbacteria bacterium CG10_big_fil_rev_8_21_14_0_10_33_19 TaxID=1974525 RepID=A0A2H0W4I5_9BACT|nr:ATP-dependent DNA helicase RecG [Candidatus Falkowbacteria bacterium]PIS06266.1 MAG: DNA helicase RecG [Candidatus Buchananbacteria bacterium CG10_big_fil_rev_8_21_14_0_10_33_19]
MISLETKVNQLNKVGIVTYSKLKRLGIETARDLIFYYPFRYEDFSEITTINNLQINSLATVNGKVEIIDGRRSFRRKTFLVEAIVTDATGSVKAVWFNQPWVSKNLKPGDEVSLSGKVSGDLVNVYFNSPEYEKIVNAGPVSAKIVPIYPLTAGLTQKQLRSLLKEIIVLSSKIEDYLPRAIIKNQSLLKLGKAVSKIHFPENKNDIDKARERLAFDELFLIQLWSKLLRKKLNQHKGYQIKFYEKETKQLVSKLSFNLTDDQRKAAWEGIIDMKGGLPMNRLVEGDVGSGKTIVTAIVAYNVALNKLQTAYLAPTEILAKQHFKTLSDLLGKLVRVGLLTRTQRIINNEIISKKEFLEKCQNGEIDIVIGTHALIQKNVHFNKLALIIVDEQHRFGVSQREALKQKSSKMPHFLSLTATPIPRSLALTVYGDLDLSIIRQAPAGRQTIITKVVPPEKRLKTYEFIREQIDQGRQIFVVCPLIDPSDKLGAKSVTEEFEKLDKDIFPDLEIGLLHGKLKTEDKDRVMNDFVVGKTKILVSTSVIEVGVDIKNATVMMIEGADRFGLAQLHQFRGRVGRNNYQSYCFLFSDSNDQKTLDRLDLMSKYSDGFELAKMDLKYRGAGQLYGYQQSGISSLKIATLDDLLLAKRASVAADYFIDQYNLDDFVSLKEKLAELNLSSHLE